MKRKWLDIGYIIITFVASYGLGILFKDKYLLGSTTLFLGCIQTLMMTKGKWFEEFFGMIETIISTVVCILACMYGSAFFTVLVYIPLSIFSMVNWKKHQEKDQVVLKNMGLSKSLLTLFAVVGGTALVAFLLSLIPTQRLSVWDAAGNILNVCGILLIALRYKEGWIVWILCNAVELATWAIALAKDFSQNSIMMIIVSAIYLLLDVWGYISFVKLTKKQEV